MTPTTRTLVSLIVRAARLYSERTDEGNVAPAERPVLLPNLRMTVQVEGPVFLLSLDYSKPVYDPASGYSFFAVTAPGELVLEPHGGDPARIASALSALLDEFLEGYVAANESAC